MKNIKIPSGEFCIIFQQNNNGFRLTDKQLWDALSDYSFKIQAKELPRITEPTLEKIYDDENPNCMKMSFEEE